MTIPQRTLYHRTAELCRGNFIIHENSVQTISMTGHNHPELNGRETPAKSKTHFF